jgi:FKBP-type peptidyl-prolyl cis-trans isomerase FkpA
MRLIVFCSATMLCVGTTAVFAGAPEPTTDEQKIFYAMGLTISRSIESFGLNESDLELVKSGISDGVLNKTPKVDLQTYGPKIQQLQQARASIIAEAEKKLGAAFLAKASSEPGAKKTESGALITTIKEGKGASPKRTDTVKVHYNGTLIDGTVFDSTLKKSEPTTLIVSEMSKCWTEGILQMKAGGKSRLICPSNLAYRDKGLAPLIKPGATLVFDIDLVEVVAKQSAPSSAHKVE